LKNEEARVYKEVTTTDVVLKFKNFVSSDALIEEDLCRSLSDADYRRYRLIACWLRTEFNIVLSGNNRPHTLQTLSEAIGLSVDETRRFIKRLAGKGLLVYTICPDSGYDKNIIMLNPHIIRKRKTVHEKMLVLFPYFLNQEKPASS
jgi:hypothetical protein